ncbi:MAG: esterase [Leptothrix sp. (in: Bacteria)]|nr:esterase [Leptothrix sp. (in: b-proteobacteria)]
MQPTIEWLPASGHAEQLILLLHGRGERAQAMAPLALALRAAFAQAAVLAPDAPWTEAETPAVLPDLLQWVHVQQQRVGVGAPATALGGCGHGAVLALALALQHDGIAGRVLAFGAALGTPPQAAPRHSTLHFFHGEADPVMPVAGARQALRVMGELQGDATLDVVVGVGHGLHPALIDCALHRLKTHIPLRTWQAALGAARDLKT